MEEAKFILSENKLLNQVNILKNLGLKISYSYKTNKEIGNLLQRTFFDVDFSVHAKEEIDSIKDKFKIWFFLQAESKEEIKSLFEEGIRNFVVDNVSDLDLLLESIEEEKIQIRLSLRMKFQEHRLGTGRYFVYGLDSNKVNEIVKKLERNLFINSLGVHIHRKSQNTSEWNIKSEIVDSLNLETLRIIKFFNIGGGLPARYKSFESRNFDYVFEKIIEARDFLKSNGIEVYVEPGRFFAAPAIKLITEIIQIQGRNIIINTSLYKCALDTLLTGTKMLIEGEISDDKEKVNEFLIKGNSPTRDDIFRHRAKLQNPKVGDKIVFLNAGAYNYTTDFFGYHKLKTEIVKDF
jgi:ornithine decarboxylase|tara:strand:+ start:363 stop:1412 length:1050 start_codon:yes stop_codon:yes gene_type:complete